MEEENLEMGLFDSDSEVQLNFDPKPFEIEDLDEFQEEEISEDQEQESEDSEESEEIEDNLDENESSEEVDEEEDQDEGDDDSPNLYSSFASVLNQQGLLPSLDLDNAKIESIDDLTEAFKSEISSQVKSYIIEKIGEKGYDALEKGISLSEYQQHQDQISTLDSINEEALSKDSELSLKVIYQDYINQGIDPKRAGRLVGAIQQSGEEAILDEAKISLASLKQTEELKLQKLQEERELKKQEELKLQEKIDNDLKNSIYSKKEFIQGIPATKAIQDKVYKSITSIVGKSPDGIPENKLMKDRRENTIEFDTKLYYLYEITNGFKDFSKINRKQTSKAVSDLEKELRRNRFEDSGTPDYLTDVQSYDGLGSELIL